MASREEMIAELERRQKRAAMIAELEKRQQAAKADEQGSDSETDEPSMGETMADLALEGAGYIGNKGLEGLGYAGEKIDSVAGGPERTALMEMAKGGGFGDAIEAYQNQFGNTGAPTGTEVAEAFGFPNEDVKVKVNSPLSGFSYTTNTNKAKELGSIIDLGADLTNLFPPAKAAKLASSLSKGMKLIKNSERVGKAAKAAKVPLNMVAKRIPDALKRPSSAIATIGSGMTGVPKASMETYINNSRRIDELGKQYSNTPEIFANKIRSETKGSIEAFMNAQNELVNASLGKRAGQTVDAKPILDSLEASKTRLDPLSPLEPRGVKDKKAAKEIQKFINEVNGFVDEAGQIEVRDLNKVKKILQDHAESAYKDQAKLLKTGAAPPRAAKGSASSARVELGRAAPEVNAPLQKQHEVLTAKETLKDSLLKKNTGFRDMLAVGRGSFDDNAQALASLGAATGEDFITPMKELAALEDMGKAGLISKESALRNAIRTGTMATIGFGLGGPIGTAISITATSPLVWKKAVQNGRIPVGMVKSLTGTTGKVTNKSYEILAEMAKTPEGMAKIQGAMKAIRIYSLHDED
jgi:hypothetical protein